MPRTRSKDSIPPFEVFTMPGTRMRRSVALVLSMVAMVGCGDYSQSTSPPPAARKLVPTFVLTSPFALVTRGSMAQAVRWGPSHQAVDQRVSAVIGAGSVGGTLARALCAAGLVPCVWNRSASRSFWLSV